VTAIDSTTLSADQVSALRHDLRTPVNHIVGYCELLLEDLEGEENAPRRAALHSALATVREVLAAINAALPASGQHVRRSDVDDLFDRLREPQSRIAEALESLIVPGREEPELVADVARIRDATAKLAAQKRTDVSPHAERNRQTVRHASASPYASDFKTNNARGRILVVDDVEDNRTVLTRHLVKQGYDVASAAGGHDALAMAAQGSYDLVLLDVRMPGIDGHQVLERLKGNPDTRDLPVVMISAADELSTIAACIEAGAEDFLPKPFDPVILRARISASIEKKRLRSMEVDYLHQVDRVVEAALAVERGQYSQQLLAGVAQRDDAVGKLARVFDTMAAGVRAREDRLNEQVSNLRKEIDQAKERADVEQSDLADSDTLIPGETFAGRYRVTRVVGRGGMGTVYKAADTELGEDVAIKLLRPEVISSDPTMAERFKSEIRLARRISHRNVVRTHDFGETSGTCYVTMEYVEGITVRDLIDMRKTLSPSSALGIARQLAAALAVAHGEGVIHRDIKPQNLLLDAGGVLKVMDFGIARLAERTTTLTQSGMVVGTPAYMAPEQLLDENTDSRSDLYSAGIVLYECLTGVLPFRAGSTVALIARVLNTVPAPPIDLADGIPLPLSSLVMKLISKEPAERPQTAVELGELLAQIS
jgi:CheY-like chemotaxis protein